MRKINAILLILAVLISVLSSAQDLKNRGFSNYKEYDNSFITPNYRKKHVLSIGGIANTYGSNFAELVPNFGAHIGYNFLIIERRKIKFTTKTIFRNETKFGFGIHFNYLSKGEFMLLTNYYRPLFTSKGRMLSWYFFCSYGLGLHKTYDELNADKPYRFDATLEFIRLRFGKSPLYLNLILNYDLANNSLGKDRMNIGILGSFKYDLNLK